MENMIEIWMFLRTILGNLINMMKYITSTLLVCFVLHPSWRILCFLHGRPGVASNPSCHKRYCRLGKHHGNMMIANYFDNIIGLV